ncbi:zinc finger protein, putative [Bodo saltans]|uniref:Zinc finger protein, putative n=1 Tax=Bodo saltans TaxID=75058 RepID=A0A0S4KKN7_BODSA|nr:zinc finger protein, putative [Bodo saltans]|eukprot:CUI14074.1 zinc finger protein, putative [Bodo saltans]
MAPKALTKGSTAKHETSTIALDCLVCAEPCAILGVFANCGHFLCYSCALRIHALDGKGCPVCRVTSTQLYVTMRAPKEEDGFDVEVELADMKDGTLCIQDKFLKCVIDNQKLAEHVRKLYEFTCPMAQCWRNGQQEPFVQEQMLRDHLQYDHQLRYCRVCLKDRRVFLSEQHVYLEKEYDQHLQGRCPIDSSSFQGHPPCKFCNNERHYDGEHLLKHMQHAHFSCDVCNRGEFTFTYYKNRDKLLEHFQRAHKLCDHSDCAHMDPMLRVFHSDLELQAHRQRAHNIGSRSGVSLDALGFRFSYAADAPNTSTQGSGAAVSTVPSTGASTHALKITFDHVSRREEVDTMPNVTSSTAAISSNNKNSRRGKAPPVTGAGRNDEESKKQGVPLAWKDPQLELRPIVVSVERLVHSPMTSSTSKAAAMPSWGTAPGAAPAMSSQSSSRAGEPTTREKEQDFDQLLHKYIPNPTLLVHFRHTCSDYLSGRILAVEFLTQLESTFFAKRLHELEIFFPYLVAVIPNAIKAEALATVKQMRGAPEIQRQQRIKEEEDAKKSGTSGARTGAPLSEMEERLLRSRQDIARLSQAQNKKKPAWASQAPAAVAAASPTTTSRTAQQLDYPTLGSTSWGGGRSGQSSVVPPPPAHVNPNEFPTLPTTSKKAHHQTAKPLTKNNAWFGTK